MEFIRGRWSKKWINCIEDKRDNDAIQRYLMRAREEKARIYCYKFNIPELTANDQKVIYEYWEQYGIKIYDFSWHRMYYFVTGLKDPRFIPDLVASMCVYPFYNDSRYESTWRDKNLFSRLCPNVPFPRTLGKCIRNRLYDIAGNCLKNDDQGIGNLCETIIKSLDSNKDIIIKNSRETGFGRSVKEYHIESMADMKQAMLEWAYKTDYIIQERVHQHAFFSDFNLSSTNIVRVFSWRHNNEVDIIYATIRAGLEGTVTDLSNKGYTRVIGVDAHGELRPHMLDQDGVIVRKLTQGLYIPAWDKIVAIIKKNHLTIDNFDCIGWDFTVDENENPICIEWNIQAPGTILYQYTNGPLFGEFTEEIFGFLKDDVNKYNYIPEFMKI